MLHDSPLDRGFPGLSSRFGNAVVDALGRSELSSVDVGASSHESETSYLSDEYHRSNERDRRKVCMPPSGSKN